MTTPCTERENIKRVSQRQEELAENHNTLHHAQHETDAKVDIVLSNQAIQAKNQERLVEQLGEHFSRLEKILISDVEHRKDLDLAEKNIERLFEKDRLREKELTTLKEFKNSCETLDIKGKVATLHTEHQQRQGLAKYRAEAIGVIAVVIAAAGFFIKYFDFTGG